MGNLLQLTTGASTSIITTGDGYRWKYMYTIPVASVTQVFSTITCLRSQTTQ